MYRYINNIIYVYHFVLFVCVHIQLSTVNTHMYMSSILCHVHVHVLFYIWSGHTICVVLETCIDRKLKEILVILFIHIRNI